MPTTSGYPNPVTRSELLDNENFGNPVNSVFTAAGGKSSLPANLMSLGFAGRTGMPGDIFNFRANQGGVFDNIDLTKWSEAERIEFLNKVASYGQDGSVSAQEHGQLSLMAANFSRNGDSEPAAVTANRLSGRRDFVPMGRNCVCV